MWRHRAAQPEMSGKNSAFSTKRGFFPEPVNRVHQLSGYVMTEFRIVSETTRLWRLPLDARELARVLGSFCRTIAAQERPLPERLVLRLADDGVIADANARLMGCAGPTNILTFPGDGSLPGELLLSLDTYVELYRGGLLPLEEFASLKKDNDILVRIHIRKNPGAFVYQAMRNQRTDFPVLTCALSRMEDGYRTVIGARPGRALVLRDETNLLAGGITEENAEAFASWAAERIPVGSNLRGSAAYRTHLVRVLVKRGLLELGGKETWN